MTNTALDVFKNIDTRDGDEAQCWPWTGSFTKDRAWFQYEGKRIAAHRLVYELVHGPLKEGEWVRHKCDNPLCHNPYHLEPGDQSDNERDKYERDRAGMPVVIVREIRMLLEKNLTHSFIAQICTKKFGREIQRPYVTKIALGYRRALNGGNERTTEEIVGEEPSSQTQ